MPCRLRQARPSMAFAKFPAPLQASWVMAVEPSIETCTVSQRRVEAIKAAISSVMSVPLVRMRKRIRFLTTPSISSFRSSRMKGSPPARQTFKTERRESSSKKVSQASVGRSSSTSSALSKW